MSTCQNSPEQIPALLESLQIFQLMVEESEKEKKSITKKQILWQKKRKNTRGIWKYLRNVGLKTQFHGRKENHNRLL